MKNLQTLIKTTLLLIVLNFHSILISQVVNLELDENFELKEFSESANEIIGHFITVDGDKVDMYKCQMTEECFIELRLADYSLSAERFFYLNSKGEVEKVKQKEISEVISGEYYYTRLKIGSIFGFNRLHQILAQNDTYVFSKYFSHGNHYYYLYNKKNEEFVYKKKTTKNNTKDDKKFASKYIKPYFKNCEKFISLLEKNLSQKYNRRMAVGVDFMTFGIPTVKCN